MTRLKEGVTLNFGEEREVNYKVILIAGSIDLLVAIT